MDFSAAPAGNDVCDKRELDGDAVRELEQWFARLPFPDYPLWPEPDGDPVRWFSDGQALLRNDGNMWLWAHARIADAVGRVRAALPGDWLMACD